MANQDKNIIVTPNIGSTTADPNIVFTGGNSNVSSSINATMYASGTLSFDGTAGQLFSITNSLTGTIFSINDISGIPSMTVNSLGNIVLAQYNGNVTIGAAQGQAGNILSIAGNTYTTGNSYVAQNQYITGNIIVSGSNDLFAGKIGIGTISTVGANGNVLSIYGSTDHYGNIELNATSGSAGIYFTDGSYQTSASGSSTPYSNTNVANYLSGPVQVGNLTINNTTASTSTVTGALRMGGGAGIAGNINVGGSNNLFTGKIGVGTSTVLGVQGNVLAVYGTINQYGNLVISNATAGGSGIYFPDGTFQTTASTATSLVAGVNQSIQFNDSGIFGGVTNFLFDKTNVRLGIGTTGALNNTLVVYGSTPAFINTTNGADQQMIVGNTTSTGTVIGFNSSAGTGSNTYGYLSAAGAASKNIAVTRTGTGIGGVTIPQNVLEVGGTTIIGLTYSGNNSFINPPSNGLAVQGSVGVGTFTPLSTLDVSGIISARTAFSTAGTATVNALVSNVYGVFGQNLTVNSTNASTTTGTGALVVAGGVGIAGNINVGGNITTTGTSGNISGVNTINTVTMNVSGNINVGGNITTTGTNGNISGVNIISTVSLVTTGNINVGGANNLFTGKVGIGTSSVLGARSNVLSIYGSTDHYGNIELNTTSGSAGIFFTDGTYLTTAAISGNYSNANVTNYLSGPVQVGNLTINNTTSSTSTVTGALLMGGGAGIQGAVHVGGLLYGASTLNIAGAAQVNSLISNGAITATTITGTAGTFTSLQNSGTTIVASLNSNTNVVATNIQSTGTATFASLNSNTNVVATNIQSTGAATVASLVANANIFGATLNTSGAAQHAGIISNTTIQSIGTLTAQAVVSNTSVAAASATITNNLFSGTLNVNGALQAGSIVSNGAVSGTTGTFTGAVFGSAINTSGTATVNALVSNTDVKTATVNATSTIVGANIYSNGFVQAAGTVTAQAISSNTTVTAGTGLTVTSGGLTVTGVSSFNGNVNITGNINVSGSITSTNSNILVVQSPLIYIGEDNPGDNYDLGLVGSYTEGSYFHTGLVRNHVTNYWTIFDKLTSEPNVITGNINWADSTLVYGPLAAGNLLIVGNTASTGTTTGAIVINGTGGLGVGGRLNVGGTAWFASTVNAGGTAIVNALVSNGAVSGTTGTFTSALFGATLNSAGTATVNALNSNGTVTGSGARFNVPTDFWNAGTGYYDIQGLGELATPGSFEVALTSNGYRNNAGTWTNSNVNAQTGAAMLALGPSGYIRFLANSVKATGSSTFPTEIMRVTEIGLGIKTTAPGSELDVAGIATFRVGTSTAGLSIANAFISNVYGLFGQNVTVNSTNASTTTGTGALIIAGGIGAAGNINVGGANSLFTNQVGIGTSTVLGARGNVLSVYGSINQYGNLVISNTASGSGIYFPDGSFQTTAAVESGLVGGINQSIQFNDASTFGGQNNFLFDKTTVRLGIGTTGTLNNTLVVYGSTPAFINTTNGADQQLIVGNTTSTGTVIGFNSSAGTGSNTYGYLSAVGAAAKNIAVTTTGTGIGGVTIPQNTLEVGGTTVIGLTYSGNSGLINPPSNGLAVQGSVGIGTFTPAAKLDVNGTVRFISGLSGANAAGPTLNYNWVQINSTIQSYKIATLPISTGSTYEHIIIEGVLGGWSSNNKYAVRLQASNRDGLNVNYLEGGASGLRSHIDFYTEADSSVSVWVVLDATTFCVASVNTTIAYGLAGSIITYPSPVTATPTGTLTFTTSTGAPNIRYGTNVAPGIGIGTSATFSTLDVNGNAGIRGAFSTTGTANVAGLTSNTTIYTTSGYSGLGVGTTVGSVVAYAPQQGGRTFISVDFNNYINLYQSIFVNLSTSSNVTAGMTGGIGYWFGMGAGDTAARGFDLVGTSSNQLWYRDRNTNAWQQVLVSGGAISGTTGVFTTSLYGATFNTAGTATVNALVSNVYGVFGQNVTVNSTNASTTTGTGALIVAGGAGIGGNINVGGTNSLFTNRVGIGTSTVLGARGNVLSVYGSINQYGNLVIGNATAGGSGIYFPDGTYQTTASTATSLVAGVNQSIQFNDGGIFGGVTNFLFDKTNVRLGIGTTGTLNNTLVVYGSTPAFINTTNGADQQLIVGNTTTTGTVIGFNSSAGTGSNTYGYLSAVGAAAKNIAVTATGTGIGGVTIPQNTLEVGGTTIIGLTYSGNNGFINPPSNGLAVQGSIGIGTFTPLSTLDVSGIISARTAFSTAGTASVGAVIANANIFGATLNTSGLAQHASLIVNANTTSSTLNVQTTALVNSLNSNTNVVATNLQSTGQATVASLVSNGAVSGTNGTFTGSLFGGTVNSAGTATVNALVSNVYGLFGQNVTVNSTNGSTTTGTGALIVAGGVGIAGNINVGGTTNYFAGNVGIGSVSPKSALDVRTAGANDGVHIIASGNGNVLVISNAIGSATPITVDRLNNMIIGAANATVATNPVSLVNTMTPQLQVIGYNQPSGTLSTQLFSTSPNVSPALILGKSSGATPGDYTVVTTNASLGLISFQGSDGNAFVIGAAINAKVDGTPASGTMPSKLEFGTTAQGDNNITNRMRIDSAGTVSVLTTTVSTSTTSGALTVAGGVGIAGNVNIGGNVAINKDLYVSGNATVANTFVVSNITFTSSNAGVYSNINASMYSSGTLSFSGSVGQLFSITNSLTGTIFSINDISGIPSMTVNSLGNIVLAQYNGNVTIGAAQGQAGNILSVTGNIYTTGNSYVAQNQYITGNIIVSGSNDLFAGKIGIGTSTTTGANGNILSVYGTTMQYGNLILQNQTAGGSGIYFPDGSFQTSAAGSSTPYSNVNVASYLSGPVQVGNLTINNATISTSTTTGALTVAGGVGIGGNINAGGTTHYLQGNVGIGNASAPVARLDLGTTSNVNVVQAVLARQGGGVADGTFQFQVLSGSGTAINSEFFKLGISYGLAIPNSYINFYRGGSTTGGFITFTTNNNTERMRIDVNGQVGIGTITALSLLDVNGNTGIRGAISTTGSATVASLTSNSTVSGVTGTFTGNVTAQSFQPTANTATIGNGMYLAATDQLAWNTAGTEAMRMDSSGRLLINLNTYVNTITSSHAIETFSTGSAGGMGILQGSNNTNGAYLLFNKSRSTTAGYLNGNILVGAVSNIQVSDTVAYIDFTANDGSNVATRTARIQVINESNTGPLLSRIAFYTTPTNANNFIEAFRIDPQGNIGTTGATITAGYNADFGGNVRSTGNVVATTFQPTSATPSLSGMFLPAANTLGFSTAAAERMRISSTGNLLIGTTTNPSGATATLLLNDAQGGGVNFTANNNGGSNIAAPSSATMTFSTFTGAVGSEVYTERMRINSSGFVGIATNTPGSVFDVNGIASFRSAISVAGTAIVAALTSNGAVSGTTGIFTGSLYGGTLNIAGASIVQSINSNTNVVATNIQSTGQASVASLVSNGAVSGTTGTFTVSLFGATVNSAGTATVNTIISNVYGLFGQNVTVNSTNASTTTGTGALVVAGGAGIGGNINVGGSRSLFTNFVGIGTSTVLGANSNVLAVYGTENLFGNLKITNTAAGGSGIYFADGTFLQSAASTYTAFNYTGNGSTTVYSTSPITASSVNNTMVFVNGVYQRKSTYTWSGTSITFSSAPANFATIEINCVQAIGNPFGVTDFTASGNIFATGNITANGSLVGLTSLIANSYISTTATTTMFATNTGTTTYNFATAATVSGASKTINIGTGGVAGSSTNVIIGTNTGGTTTVNSPSLIVPGNFSVGANIPATTGPILTFGNITTGGTGYMDGTHVNVSLTGGTGASALANVVVASGIVTTVTLAWGGNRYSANDVLTVPTFSDTLATTAASGTGAVATLSFAAQPAAPFQINAQIVVAGVTPVGYNGTYTVTACTTTSVSYASATTGAQTVAGTIAMGAALTAATIPVATIQGADIYVSSFTSNSIGSRLRLEANDTTISTGQEYGAITFSSRDASVRGSGDIGLIRGVAAGTSGGSDIQFWTAANGEAPNISAVVTASGNFRLYDSTGLFYNELANTPTANRIVTIPDAAFTMAGIDLAQTISAVNTFTAVPILPNGSAAAPGLRFTTDATSGLFSPATNTVAVSTSGVERVRVDSAGQVGIGTISPASKLHVQASSGTGIISNVTANNWGMVVVSNGSNASGIWMTAANTGQLALRDNANNLVAIDTSAGSMKFSTGGAEQVRIDLNGNVGIGTATITNGYILDVYGNVRVTAGIMALSDITAYFSDKRLKSNITAITNAVDKVMSINGVYYNANQLAADLMGEDITVRHVGLLAQEVEAVLPQVVRAAPFDVGDNGISKSGEHYKTLQYDKIVPLLVEAIKEQQGQIDALTAKITALERVINK